MGFDVLVFAEQRDGAFKKSAFECLALAQSLAGGEGVVSAVLVGSSIKPLADQLFAHGAARVYLADDPSLALCNSDAYTAVVRKAFDVAAPALVLFGATAMGRDLAPAFAARIGVPWISEALEMKRLPEGGLEARKSMYGGKVFTTLQTKGDPPYVATVRPGSFDAGEAAQGKSGETIELPLPEAPKAALAKVVEMIVSEGEKVDLQEADVVVSGGRGLKAPENFALIQDLAEALGGAVGASRAVVDAGWIEHQHQVGQTGTAVAPKLYIAAGISGAIQHVAGMRSSGCIVAINKDPDAPIFQIADYGIVGDLFEVLPILSEEVRKMRSG